MDKSHLLSLSDNTHYPYQLIHSKRAKYIRIKISKLGALSVVLPKGAATQLGHEFLQTKSLWVEKNLKKISAFEATKPPEVLDLKLLGEAWIVDYSSIEEDRVTVEELTNYQLRISANKKNINNVNLLHQSINQWCKRKARKVFNHMLEDLAEEYGFHYHRLSIRTQKTRWGSCSSKKNINLNAKLLFMPEEIVKYVMIHELCHTIEMNHSARFWTLVEECDPNFKENRKQLKQLGRQIAL